MDDNEAAIPANPTTTNSTIKNDSPAKKSISATSEDDDKVLMPPPSIPLRGPNRFQLHFLSVYTSIELSSSILIVCLSFYCTENWSSLDSGRSESGDKTIDDDRSLERKLETPLAAMLPSKYANVDVRDLFPDFRPDKVLRFSRLFGPGKPTSLPQIWRSVRRKRRKRKHSRESGKVC